MVFQVINTWLDKKYFDNWDSKSSESKRSEVCWELRYKFKRKDWLSFLIGSKIKAYG